MKAQAQDAIKQTLSERAQTQKGALFQNSPAAKLIITASDDQGVMRNGGRRGAAFAPKCIVHAYKKFAQGQKDQAPIELFELIESNLNFDQMQQVQRNKILELLKSFKRSHLVHLGGGHDHVFPLLAALAESTDKSIHVINIDAHLDTRNDAHAHSGTPFRQFQKLLGQRARITQIGIQDFANAATNWQEMNMSVHRLDVLENTTCGFTSYDDGMITKLLEIKSDELCLFSIDLDAIAVSDMPAVSAVNPAGLPLMFVRALLKNYLNKMDQLGQSRVVGLYEFNPMFDDVSGSAAKTVAGLIQLTLE